MQSMSVNVCPPNEMLLFRFHLAVVALVYKYSQRPFLATPMLLYPTRPLSLLNLLYTLFKELE
jgi:hypothetical protein